MRYAIAFLAAVLSVSYLGRASEEKQDTTLYRFPSLTVIGRALFIGAHEIVAAKAGVYDVMESQGIVQLIRRGSFLGSDIYLRGFKRGEIGVAIDGVRFPNACPNRMDVPLARVEPVDVDRVVVDYSGVALPGGLGGTVVYQRQPVQRPLHIQTELVGQIGAEPFVDASLLAQAHQQRLAVRWLQLRSYTDGQGKTFGERYGYTADHITSRWVDVMTRGRLAAVEYDARLNVAHDIPFPALMMDERRNVTGMASIALGEHRLYGVYTWHRMNNELRREASSMVMGTDARTLILGLTGSVYEGFYRFWKARNTMHSGMSHMQQDVIPSVHTVRATASHRLTGLLIDVRARLGLALMWLGDTTRMGLYRGLYPEAKRVRWYVPFGVAVGYRWQHPQDWTAAAQAELSSDAPTEEQLFFALERPMGRPFVLGNPTLPQPIRLGLRATLGWIPYSVELHAVTSYVWNYPYVVNQQRDNRRYQTYEGIRALMASVSLVHQSEYVDAHAEYTWGERVADKSPLAEIAPITIGLTGKSPRIWNLQLWARAVYAGKQKRVDASLQEQPTPDWFRLDGGMYWQHPWLRLGIEVTNIFNRQYRRHLSYIRNPYAAGTTVYEPGRSIRLWAQLGWGRQQ
ncbi:MAG: TonB-dependent receptor plug domain-containing protein [Chlorobiota bacterium]